jgi:hypothetical protein
MSRYFRMVKTTLHPGNRALAEQIGDQAVVRLSKLPGIVPDSIVFFLDDEDNTFGAISLWESREAAVNAGEAMEAGTIKALGDARASELEVSIYEVYEPK